MFGALLSHLTALCQACSSNGHAVKNVANVRLLFCLRGDVSAPIHASPHAPTPRPYLGLSTKPYSFRSIPASIWLP
ncbi:hypothetical protein B0H34DRAFT_511854 [Crassisporium funariophilum]|nr:hypothetical protein B0H34DRAFT_511854 [Crassisporium funariophilum]